MTTPAQINIEMFRGDTAMWDVLVTLDGAAVNLTGGTLTFSVRRNHASPRLFFRTSDPSGGIEFASPQSGATLGRATVQLLSEDTTQLSNQETTLVYDVHFRAADGDEWTVAWGNLTVHPSVTM